MSKPSRKINPEVKGLIRQASKEIMIRPMVLLSLPEQEAAMSTLQIHGGMRTDRQLCAELGLCYEHFVNTMESETHRDWADAMRRIRRAQLSETTQLLQININKGLASFADLDMTELNAAAAALLKLRNLIEHEEGNAPARPVQIRKAIAGSRYPETVGGALGSEASEQNSEASAHETVDGGSDAASAYGRAEGPSASEANDDDSERVFGNAPHFELPDFKGPGIEVDGNVGLDRKEKVR